MFPVTANPLGPESLLKFLISLSAICGNPGTVNNDSLARYIDWSNSLMLTFQLNKMFPQIFFKHWENNIRVILFAMQTMVCEITCYLELAIIRILLLQNVIDILFYTSFWVYPQNFWKKHIMQNSISCYPIFCIIFLMEKSNKIGLLRMSFGWTVVWKSPSLSIDLSQLVDWN